MIDPLNRRRFLFATGAAFVQAACSSAPNPAQPQQPDPDVSRKVVIIGAGLSGLVIALDLLEQGFDPIVLEAADRPGGRIHTLAAFRPTFHIEAGATFVVNDPDLMKLLNTHNIKLAPKKPRNKSLSRVVLRGSERLVIPPGGEMPDFYGLTAEEQDGGPFGPVDKFFPDIKGIDPTDPHPKSLLVYDNVSAADYLRKRGASAAYMASLRDTFVPNVPLEQTSALSLMRELANIHREIAFEPLPGDRILGGSDVLPKTLAEKLGKRVIYRARVVQIDQSGPAVKVTFMHTDIPAGFMSNDSVGTISAGRVVSTLPSTVLRDVKFVPDLSAGKQRALQELRMVNVTRIWVGTTKRVWVGKNEAGEVENDGAMGKVRHETEHQDGEVGVLGVYTTGAEARRLAKRNELERVAEMIALAERAHPGFKEHFTIGKTKCWDEDPLQKGAYAEFSPGQISTLVPELARVEGRVHFAGDQLSHRPGFMHGALASARRVVKEIVEGDKK